MRLGDGFMNNKILVSVICLTYNQEKYIAQCMDSLVNQNTRFKYEIIVHDDNSNDDTQKILTEYETRYSDRVSLILQDENQYSKGINILDDIVVPRAKGKYIAICEGDDYWTDINKLEKQVEAMENNSKCWICSHAVSMVDEEGLNVIGKIAPSERNCIFNIAEVIKGDGGFVGTNSLLIRREAFEQKYTFRKVYPLDYFLQIMGTLHGGMLYLTDEMSAYRTFSEGSWSNSMMQDQEKFCRHYKKMIIALRQLDDETEQVYHDEIEHIIFRQEFNILNIEKKYREIIKNKKFLEVLSLREILNTLKKCIKP